jgi:hypothetical protein
VAEAGAASAAQKAIAASEAVQRPIIAFSPDPTRNPSSD